MLVSVCGGFISSADFDFPSAHISNGLIDATLYLPDADRGYYQGVRFDWSGVIPQLTYQGHSYFDKWNPNPYEAQLHDNIMGPVEEFTPLGYEEAQRGETFLKIGVGMLTKTFDKKYSFAERYPIQNAGKWTVKTAKSQVIFLHELTDDSGYGYIYTKTVKLTKGKPELVLEHRLKNIGQKIIETSVYNHNFFMIDNEPTNPNIKTSFPFDVAAEGKNWGTIAKTEKNAIHYTRALETGEFVYSDGLKGFGSSSKDYDILIQNLKSGAGVRITCDKPLDKFVYWACPSTACPEPYIKITAQPNDEVSWKIKYAFVVDK